MLKNYIKIALKVFWRHKFLTGVNLFGICFTHGGADGGDGLHRPGSGTHPARSPLRPHPVSRLAVPEVYCNRLISQSSEGRTPEL